jgi:hypothetical protein
MEKQFNIFKVCYFEVLDALSKPTEKVHRGSGNGSSRCAPSLRNQALKQGNSYAHCLEATEKGKKQPFSVTSLSL